MRRAQPARGGGSELCTQCGLCCQGVLHDRADLEHAERDLGEQLGLTVEPCGDRLAFQLPCPRLSGTLCSVYDNRPKACSGYECGLLRRYKAEDVTLERALELVAEAKKLVVELREVMLPGQSLGEARAEWREKSHNWRQEDSSTAEGRAALARHFRMMTLNLFLDRNFRSDAEGKFTVMK